MNEEIKCETYIPWRLRVKNFLNKYENILTGLALLIVICLGLYNVCSVFANSFGYNMKAEISYHIRKIW